MLEMSAFILYTVANSVDDIKLPSFLLVGCQTADPSVQMHC